MESARGRPVGMVDSRALADVARAYQAAGPFVSVYLVTEPGIENAGPTAALHWKALRQDLVEQGAPTGALEALDALVPDAHQQGRTLVAAATSEGVAVVRHEAEPARHDIGWGDALPRLGPVIAWEQAAIPHLVVLADRAGADVIAARDGRSDTLLVGPNDGRDPGLRRSAPGGWSQRRYQQRAENLWEERAGEVADAVESAVGDVGARLVVVAGDVRAVAFLREALPARMADLVHEVAGGRSPDGSTDEIAAETVRLVASVAAEDTVAYLRRFKEEAGRGGRATEGVEATLAALREARVDVLLVHDDPGDERRACFGPAGHLVAAEAGVLVDLGVDQPSDARLVDVAIRGAFTTGAGVRVIPDVVGEGIGALLRH